MLQTPISYQEARKICLDYFKGDEIATDAYLSKYALKADGDKNKILEPTPDHMHRRMAREFARIEKKFKNPLSEEEIFDLFDHFKYLVPQGGSMAGIGNPEPVSLANCFVVGNRYDSYGAICKTDEELVQISKRRGGVGTDISYLRPAGSRVHNAALTSSGAVEFMDRFSHSIREVAQSGRRGALMLSCSIKHPSAEGFIDAKLDTGKVTGANISIKLTDEFMNCVKTDEEFTQQFPIDSDEPLVTQKVSAKRIWNKIIHNAWKCAEPGVVFWDTIINESTGARYGKQYEEYSLNPCFTGDTIIAVADGRNGVPIKQLAEEGGRFPVYSAHNAKHGNKAGTRSANRWKTDIQWATAFKTGVKKVIEVVLSDGSSFRCTPEHRLALPDTTYVEAKDSLGLTLAKFYTRSNLMTEKSYRIINSKIYYRQYRMIYEFLHGKYDTKKYNIHHKDHNSRNDSLDNLELISVEEHAKDTLERRKGNNNPFHKVPAGYRSLIQARRNINANATRWGWSEERRLAELAKFDKEHEGEAEMYKSMHPCNPVVNEPVKVVEIRECGEEPVYDLTVENNHNFYIITDTYDDNYLNCSGVLVHNCAELPLPLYGSCILLCMNLYSYVKNPFLSSSYFDTELFKHHVRIAQKLADDIIELEQEKIDQIIAKIQSDPEDDVIKSRELHLWESVKKNHTSLRRTGLGITGLGDMLAALGHTYGTQEATDVAEMVQSMLAVEAYRESTELAKDRGCFPIWNAKTEESAPFVQRMLKYFTVEEKRKYLRYGRRNVAMLTIAPTGTLSCLTQTTSGVECVFMPFYVRRRKVADGEKFDFQDKTGDKFKEYLVVHPKLVEWFIANSEEPISYVDAIKHLSELSTKDIQELVAKSPYHNATTQDVDWIGKVKMQGALQKFVDHSISVTVNLPKWVDEELVSKVYMTAWQYGCKGCTIYRDGSRDGVLIAKEDQQEKKVNTLPSGALSKRKAVLPAVVDVIRSKGESFAVFTGIDDNRPYEVFAFKLHSPEEIKFFKNLGQTTITKIKKKHYSLGSECSSIEGYDNILTRFGSEEEQAITRMVSTMLRGGRIPLEEIIDQIIKSSTSIEKFSKILAINLQKFLKSGITLHEKCPNCGGDMISYEGCKKCSKCGQSKCG